MQSFRQIDSKLWNVGAIQNQYPSVIVKTLTITFRSLENDDSERRTNQNSILLSTRKPWTL